MPWRRPLLATVLILLGLLAAQQWLRREPPEIRLTTAVSEGAASDTNAGAIVGGDFSLIDTEGRAVSRLSYPGRHLLISFGFRDCPDLCPLLLDTVSEALARLGPGANRVQPLFVALDSGEEDTERLATFVAGFDTRLVGLWGTPAAVADLGRRYRLGPAAGSAPDAKNAEHNAVLYLLGPDGRVLAYFPHWVTADELAQSLTQFLAQSLSSGLLPPA